MPVISDGQMKRIVRTRRRNPLRVDQHLQRSRDLEVRGAAAGVVVRARLLVIEMAAEHDVAGGGDRCRESSRPAFRSGIASSLRARTTACSVMRSPRGEPLLQRPRLADRNHDRERVPAAARVEMAPANQILIVAPPRADLVRVVADETGGAELLDRLAMARGRRRVAQHELAADILAVVVAALRCRAPTSTSSTVTSALSLLSATASRTSSYETIRRGVRLRLRRASRPRRASRDCRAACRTRSSPSPGNVSTCTSAQPGGVGAADDVFDRLVKAGRRGNTMQLRQAADVILGRNAGQLLVERLSGSERSSSVSAGTLGRASRGCPASRVGGACSA